MRIRAPTRWLNAVSMHVAESVCRESLCYVVIVLAIDSIILDAHIDIINIGYMKLKRLFHFSRSTLDTLLLRHNSPTEATLRCFDSIISIELNHCLSREVPRWNHIICYFKNHRTTALISFRVSSVLLTHWCFSPNK